MKIYLYNRKDVRVFQNSTPLKIYCEQGREYVVPQVGDDGRYQIDFVKKSEFDGALWFLRALLFWIIGIMGIFTPRYSKCTHTLDCRLYGFGDSNLNVSFIHPSGKVGECTAVKVKETGDTQTAYLEGEKYLLNPTAARRKKFYGFLSAIARLAVIVIVAIVIVKAIIG